MPRAPGSFVMWSAWWWCVVGLAGLRVIAACVGWCRRGCPGGTSWKVTRIISYEYRAILLCMCGTHFFCGSFVIPFAPPRVVVVLLYDILKKKLLLLDNIRAILVFFIWAPSLCAPITHRCFQKSLPRSLFYMARDMGCLLALQYVYPEYVAGSWPLTLLWWNANGFMLWALFVVGERRSWNDRSLCDPCMFCDNSQRSRVCVCVFLSSWSLPRRWMGPHIM